MSAQELVTFNSGLRGHPSITILAPRSMSTEGLSAIYGSHPLLDGSHISGPVVPTVPFWKNIAKIAIMAKRPFASSAASFTSSTSRNSTRKASNTPNN
eukprot:2482464-Amphidinium_carterae.1